MKPTVYIETSVISYLTSRPSRDLIVAAHQQITAEWWERDSHKFECLVCQAVLDEISQGDPAAAKRRQEAIKEFTLLEFTSEVGRLADNYFEALQLPKSAKPDALHLAMATWHSVDYLVTWNCRHIANGRVERLIRSINDNRGIQTPVICTPEELQEY